MPVNFEKADNIHPQQQKSELEFVEIKLSWTKRHKFGSEFDLDLSCFIINNHGKICCEKDLIFYNNQTSDCGAVIYYEDNRIGFDNVSSGESITIDFPKIKKYISQVLIAVSIHDAQKRGQNFGVIKDARLDIVNRRNNALLAHYELSEEFADETAVIICGFYHEKGEWILKDIVEHRAETLADLAKYYGIDKTHT